MRSSRASPATSRSATAPSDGDIFGGGLEKDQIPLDAALEALRPVLEDPAVLKIGQNIKDDWLVLARHGIEMAPVDDTMLMSYALDAGALKHGHGLGELVQELLGHERIELKAVAGTGKDKVGFDRVPIDKATAYAAEDADLALRLWSVLKARLPAERVTRVYERLERPMVPVLGAHGAARHQGRPADPFAPLRELSRRRRRRPKPRSTSSPARNSTSARPSSSATSSTARWGSPAARRPRPANGRPT